MKLSFRILFLPFLVCLAFVLPVNGAVVFKPGEKAHYRTPGEEEMSGTARQLFDRAQAAEAKGDIGGAIKAYRMIVKKHPHDTLAAGSAYRLGQLLEQTHKYLPAADAYAVLCEKYSKSEHFEDAVTALFRIGEMYLTGQKTKILGITVKSGLDQAADIFTMIIRTAPYDKYTARAQFDLGRAREKQGQNEAAIAAYQAVVEKFPDDPIAVDAQYQIGYIWSKASSSGTYDPAAATKSKIAFEDFLARYPNSEKASQAKQNLKKMEHKQSSTAYDIAKFYDKQKQYRAAAIYYNEVIRTQPGSTEGERAKKRISELRAKVGDAKLQAPAVTAAAASKKKVKARTQESGPPPSSNELAPLPPSDVDASLPPPASLLPDTTTAPPPSSDSTAAPSATPQPTPEAAATP
ncbi:MAG TPA: outer membrane protein assembly factor BamD [Chthoniobacterales bacterium]|nr:outer membrane protein assembly factor BamD [Chthoniobacterales bacterium]